MGNFDNLPPDIILDILSRLQTESVSECKLVCKSWRNQVRHPSFSRMQLTHLSDDPAGNLTFLLLKPYRYTEHQQIHYFEYDHEYETHRIRKINIKPPFDENSGGYGIIGSVNGLICLNACNDHTLFDYQPAYICNPVTKEYVIVPKLNREMGGGDVNLRQNFHDVYSGFGYLRSSNEYKVVRLDRRPNFEGVEVYTLGNGNGWRNVAGEYGIDLSVFSFVNDYGVFANETLHWITLDGKIVAFNLADENFCELPPLPCLSLADNVDLNFEIGILGGILWCSILDECTRKTDIWLLRKNGNQNMEEQDDYRSLTWCQEFGLVGMKPLALAKSGAVLCYSPTDLYSYDINPFRFRMFLNFSSMYLPSDNSS